MRRLYYSILLAFCASAGTQAQDLSAIEVSNNIKAEHMSTYLHKLASDEFEGRETGQKGQKLAAEYIANHFKSLGIPALKSGGYFQQYKVRKDTWESYSVKLSDSTGKMIVDYTGVKPEKDLVSFNITFPPNDNKKGTEATQFVFLGYGIKSDNYDDYKNVDVKGKVVIVLEKEPMGKDSNYLVTKNKELSEWTLNWRKKLQTATEQGAAGIIFISEDFTAFLRGMGRSISYAPLKLLGTKDGIKTYIPSFYMGADKLNALLPKTTSFEKLKETIKNSASPASMAIKAKLNYATSKASTIIEAENVLGYVEGSDLKNELIVMSAHYDHLGIEDGKIFYGADDDGSGTAAVMELARTFAEAKKNGKGPRRSLLFLSVSGEEKGLLGSEYYSENPVFPLENTVADLNIDMIGRLDEKHKDNSNYIYVIGSDKLSTDLHKIGENANSTYTKLELDYTYNDPKDPNRFYYRSDHYNFAKHNIPIIFYFNGVHADYHKASDTVDKIDFKKMEKITKLVFFTAWDLANRNERIKVDVVSDFKNDR